MILALLACGVPTAPSAPEEEPATPVVEERTIHDASRYRRGAGVVVAHGLPCTVERVDIESGERSLMFSVDGACPAHCAFEARMAVCVQGTRVVRHAFGDHSLPLVDEEVLASTERVFIAPDGIAHAVTREGDDRVEREILVTGTRTLRALPMDAAMEDLRFELSRRAFDLDSIQADCPSGVCYAFGAPHPDAIAAYIARHGSEPAHRMFMPDRPVFFQERDGRPTGPVEICDDAACKEPVPVEVPDGPVALVAHPPFLIVRAGGEARVIGVDGAPSRELGRADWATPMPFDLSL